MAKLGKKVVRRAMVAAREDIKLLEKLNEDQIRFLKLIIDSKATDELKKVNTYTKALNFLLKKAIIKDGDVSDNRKLGTMGSWQELPGDCEYYIPEFDVWVRGTCGKHCKGCFNPENPRKSACYCFKAIMMRTNKNEDGTPGDIIMNKCAVKTGYFYRTVAMLYFRDYLLESLDKKLINKKGKMSIVRINEAGEITCKEDLMLWAELATRHPEVMFYLYTKNYATVRFCIENDLIPDNLFINISVWHKAGIKEYQEFAWHPQIRAYVFVDKEWTVEKYAKHGMIITAMCPAYDSKGKMNHNITCDKCGKRHCCSHFNKITGCFEH